MDNWLHTAAARQDQTRAMHASSLQFDRPRLAAMQPLQPAFLDRDAVVGEVPIRTRRTPRATEVVRENFPGKELHRTAEPPETPQRLSRVVLGQRTEVRVVLVAQRRHAD